MKGYYSYSVANIELQINQCNRSQAIVRKLMMEKTLLFAGVNVGQKNILFPKIVS